MAVTFSTTAASSGSGSTSVSVAYPSGILAGHKLVMWVVNKPSTATPTVPSGWSVPTNGTATGGIGTDPGNQTGLVRITVMTKIADGTETGSLSVTITSGTVSAGRMERITRDSTATFASDVCVNGTFATGNSLSWSAAMGSDPGVSAGDGILTASASNSNAQAFATAGSVTQSGVTFNSSTSRDNAGLTLSSVTARSVCDTRTVASGVSSGTPTYNITATGTATASSPTGPTVMLRIRELYSPGGTVSTSTWSASDAQSSVSVGATSASAAWSASSAAEVTPAVGTSATASWVADSAGVEVSVSGTKSSRSWVADSAGVEVSVSGTKASQSWSAFDAGDTEQVIGLSATSAWDASTSALLAAVPAEQSASAWSTIAVSILASAIGDPATSAWTAAHATPKEYVYGADLSVSVSSGLDMTASAQNGIDLTVGIA